MSFETPAFLHLRSTNRQPAARITRKLVRKPSTIAASPATTSAMTGSPKDWFSQRLLSTLRAAHHAGKDA